MGRLAERIMAQQSRGSSFQINEALGAFTCHKCFVRIVSFHREITCISLNKSTSRCQRVLTRRCMVNASPKAETFDLYGFSRTYLCDNGYVIRRQSLIG